MRLLGIAIATVFAVACADAKAQQRPIDENGRYQIINGTPQFARNIMLLDTQTGRTWIQCETGDSAKFVTQGSNWCEMLRIPLRADR